MTVGLQPSFSSSLSSMFAAMPASLRATVSSGYRSRTRQAQLFSAAVKKYGSVSAARKWVAPPGRSRHNLGIAADLAFSSPTAKKWVHEHAAEFGLHFPMAWEPWHIEPIGSRGSKGSPGDTGKYRGQQYSLAAAGARVRGRSGGFHPEPATAPSADIIGLDSTDQLLGGELPAGMRNNNPGNLKYSGNSKRLFPGVVGPSVNTDQGDPQIVFDNPMNGMIAAAKLALRKFKQGKDTVEKLVSDPGGWTPGYTPASVNIAATMGIDPKEKIDLRSPDVLTKFLGALVVQEHGDAGKAYADILEPSAKIALNPNEVGGPDERAAPKGPTPLSPNEIGGPDERAARPNDSTLRFPTLPELMSGALNPSSIADSFGADVPDGGIFDSPDAESNVLSDIYAALGDMGSGDAGGGGGGSLGDLFGSGGMEAPPIPDIPPAQMIDVQTPETQFLQESTIFRDRYQKLREVQGGGQT